MHTERMQYEIGKLQKLKYEFYIEFKQFKNWVFIIVYLLLYIALKFGIYTQARVQLKFQSLH